MLAIVLIVNLVLVQPVRHLTIERDIFISKSGRFAHSLVDVILLFGCAACGDDKIVHFVRLVV